MESQSVEQFRMCKKLHHYDGNRMNRFRNRKIGSISTSILNVETFTQLVSGSQNRCLKVC